MGWLLATFAVHGSEFAISPPYFEIKVGSQPVTESLRVFNFSGEPIEFQVSVANWTLNENNDVVILEPTEQSLDQWMLINPLRLTVPAQESAAVRFSIRPRVRPEPGEHRAMIYISEVDPKRAGHIYIRGKLGVAVYGFVGEVTREGLLHEVRVVPDHHPPAVLLDIENRGTAHIRMSGQFAVWQASRFPGKDQTGEIMGLGKPEAKIPEGVVDAGKLTATPVLPGMRRNIPTLFGKMLPPGDYVLDIKGLLGERAITRAVSFTVAVPATPSDNQR